MATDGETGPLFKVVTKPGMEDAHGTRLFFMGVEVPMLQGFTYSVDYSNAGDLAVTKINIVLCGTQVETEFAPNK